MSLTDAEHASLLRLKGPTVHTSPYLLPLSRVADVRIGHIRSLQGHAGSAWRRMTDGQREVERRKLRQWFRRRGLTLKWEDTSAPANRNAGRPAYIGRRWVGWQI